jgi:hypothetical protein
MAHAATGSRVDHRRQYLTQPWGNVDRIRQAEVDQVISGSTNRGRCRRGHGSRFD